jgi:quinol monooxygenase YgiN
LPPNGALGPERKWAKVWRRLWRFRACGKCPRMYGLIGKMIAVPGQRDPLIAILLASIEDMPGCRSYVVARDPGEADAIWITEVWDDPQSHKASLSLPAVQSAIARAKPLIKEFAAHFITEPVGGHGLGK